MNKKEKIDLSMLIILISFFIISIITIYSSLTYLPKEMGNLLSKQIMFYILGFICIFIINKLGNNFLIKNSFYIYLLNIILLIIVLLFGDEINGTKAWLNIPIFGSIQPSEFMKIGLILYLSKIIDQMKKNKDSDIKIIITSIIIFIIPTILTFLEPDTGAVIVYFIITSVLLFTSGIKYKWFITLFLLLSIIIGSVFYLYFYQRELFINILGSDFFYRLERIFDWTNSSGIQLENSLISISSSGLFGHGFNEIPIYFPELQTDFVFSSFISCFGIVGGFLLIGLFIILDIKIINIGLYSKKNINKLIAISITSVLLYQQIQNMAMTIGILPITGITLPFISYGGSSLLSFMILIGIVNNIKKND